MRHVCLLTLSPSHSPDEYPFTDPKLLPEPILPPVEYPHLLWPSNNGHRINENKRIFKFYVSSIVPTICKRHGEEVLGDPIQINDEANDDGQYGSAAVRDVEILSALSRRIHFGMFVSESKFRSAPADFVPYIISKPPNREKLEALITKPAVEAALLKRLAEKARVYGGDFDAAFKARSAGHGEQEQARERERQRKIEVDEVVELYKEFVIPLTKVVEVDYLERRLEGLTEAQIKALAEGKSWDEVSSWGK